MLLSENASFCNCNFKYQRNEVSPIHLFSFDTKSQFNLMDNNIRQNVLIYVTHKEIGSEDIILTECPAIYFPV